MILKSRQVLSILFSQYTAPCLPLFTKLSLLNIYQINYFLIGSFSFSLNSKVLPSYFSDFCIGNAQVHGYNTREKGHLHKIFSRTNYGKYSTKNKVVDIWNRIPLSIKCSASIKIFKRKLKFFLLSHVVIVQ